MYQNKVLITTMLRVTDRTDEDKSSTDDEEEDDLMYETYCFRVCPKYR